MNVEFSYPIWLVFVCVLLGVIYSVLFYRKEKLLSEVSNWIIYSMALLRFTVVTFLALLLLEPLIQNESQKIEKPIVVIALDNSQSVVLNKDSLFYQEEFQHKLITVKNKLSEKYEVKTISFGEKLTDGFEFGFDEKQTDFSLLLDDLYAKYYGRNLGAVIVAADGVFNKGQNPVYASSNLKNTSIYTIALGDTAKKKDVAIANVVHNKLAYLGNDFPIEVVVSADYFNKKKAVAKVIKGEKTIATQELIFNSDNDIQTIPFKIEAKSAGKQKYIVQIETTDEEFTLVNNRSEVFIEVLDNKQKILIVAAAPHPDIAALKTSIEKNINYQVDIINVMDYSGKLSEYNLVVLHNVPSVNGGENKLMADIESEKIPVLFFIGAQTQFSTFNKLKCGLSIIAPKGVTNAKASINSGFNSFTIDEGLKSLLPELPPLEIPFAGDYKVSTGANILLYQKIGSTITSYPLVGFNEKNGQKIGFVLGEGIWRWKFQDFIKNKNSNNFESLISKVVQFLAVKEDKNKFRVSTTGEFLENENVVLQAELYNDIYELINDAEVTLDITNEQGEAYPQKAFAKIGQSYRLDAGVFSPGSYTFSAKTTSNSVKYEVNGEFIVKELKVEYLDAVSDHALLYALAEKTGGKMYPKGNFDEIIDDIEKNNNIASLSYVNKELTDIINWKWILLMIIGLLSIEWFLRKRNGAY
jgi:hypothetical protein